MHTESGGSLMGFSPAVDLALKRIDDATQVIAGRRPLSNKKELTEFRHVMDAIAKRADKLFKAGKSKQQMVEARPTRDFDAKWNRDTPRTPDQ